ncbi:extracellular solute-binding protein [Phyllobacterium sp. 628]|uniref:extracellular solute-binding protein n=1 Tax=Phyllobacterium sp. 628 TaxID=2718938 RepID=UPI0016628ADC|nr:extracellular solute-binding protein [Phyllobacterium sp. 628]QND52074.1 extracellular solute-binding protein [Phyllobacterium sp. 628]
MRSKLFTSTLLAISILVQPALASAVEAKEVTIRVSSTPLIYASLFKQLAAAFQERNPDVKVKLETPNGDQTDAIQLALRQGLVNDLADVSFQGVNYTTPLVDRGYVVPLDDFIVHDSEWTNENYSPSVSEIAKVGDKTMGLGVALTVPIIYYNADLVAEAQNGKSALPADWTAMLELAKKIQAAHPDVLGIYTRYNALVAQGLIMSMGGTIGKPDGTAATLTEKPALEAIRLIADFGKAGQGKLGLSDNQARQQFLAGKLAIMLDSASSLQSYTEKSSGVFRLATAHFPFIEKSKMPAFGLIAVMHTQDAERQKAAWKFMKFVAGPEGQNMVGRQTGYVPANKIAIQRSDVLGDYYKSVPGIQASLDTLPLSVPYYVFPGDGNAARVNQMFVDVLQRVVVGQLKPEDGAQELNQQIDAVIGK